MLRIASLVALLMPLGACTLWFGGDDDDDECLVPASDWNGREQEIAPAPLRDPGDLTCDSYGGPYCNPECGPCPEYATGAADLAPLPSYGYCGHICESYGEGQCAADPQCRVVLDANCSFGESNCFTNFMGCFPTDNVQNNSINCWTADAWECSTSNACTAYHGSAACPPEGDPSQCARPFALCAPEGEDPGQCNQAVACDALPPECPSGSMPGVSNGCYTGACIPSTYCDILGG